ncbi:hypothetical protein QUF49_09660 [Fictibacillus sp. b24]|uniref:DUF6944 family repetitive protein n=1 Tax=Fictibacillus sp. b24 TaxID=3055863 RepID=UPI0025A080B1|nr:hypothetical protein [Fictibacillus sp. b24]MDM5316259.1 hypothetical protein [Fictibacillus sp. b24]
MDNQLKQQVGTVIQAIGTVISAIANTPISFLSDSFQEDLDLIGNTLQAVGSGLVADGLQPCSLSRIGNEVQAIGNTTVIAGMLLPLEDKTSQILNIKGNLLQAVGAGIELGDELDEEPSTGEALSVISNLLQAAGNSLQALGGKYELDNPNGDDAYSQSLTVAGSWIQAVGAVISALPQQ